MAEQTYAERVARMTLTDIADAEYAMRVAPEAFNDEHRALIRERKLRLMKEAKR